MQPKMHPKINKILHILFSIFIYLIFVSPKAYAASVIKSNAKQALIQLDDLEFSVTNGDQVVVMQNSKRVGILKIIQIEKGKAKANILRGKAPAGAQVVTANGSSGGVHDSNVVAKKKWHYGGILGYTMDSQTTTLGASPGVDVSQSGTGYAVKGFGEIAVSGNLWFQGRAGIQTFKVSGTAPTAVCSGPSTNCSTSITYLDGDALLKYNFPFKTFTPFVAGGLGLFLPLTKSSTALNSIPVISVFFIDAGVDIQLSEKAYVPIYAEYGLFPPSNQVKTNYIGVMIGYGLRL